ncbi:family 1 glycosylhydrolase [Bacillus salipaludis]|uniref:Family 1 glycosylhydrolase n=1 Tax=Bacillus salipaludis TaxID=2547811 RepID=A0ABW8RHY7_9BACI
MPYIFKVSLNACSQAYRFSVSWARILPNGSEGTNEKGLQS